LISIVGTRIYIYQSIDYAFRVKYRNSEGDIFNFTPTDTITMIIRDRDTEKIILSKVAESITINDEPCSIIVFTSRDMIPKGDYKYDLILGTIDDSKHMLVSKADLNVLEDRTLTRDLPQLGEFEPHSLEDINSNTMSLSKDELICNFTPIIINKEEAEGTLILFNKINKVDDTDEDTTEGDLILFDPKVENSEDTLILF